MPGTRSTAGIQPGARARLHLAIWLDDGTEVLSSFDDEPLDFCIGDGTLAPGLESMLLGLEVGADEQLLADGAAVYGASDPALVQVIDREDLPPDFELVPGRVMLFAAPGGQETAGTLIGETDRGVEVDFNHPLSRRGLRIRVQVLDVR
jgi:FKBP-type peptidyl-prolyl cis-trans isomerase SlpA